VKELLKPFLHGAGHPDANHNLLESNNHEGSVFRPLSQRMASPSNLSVKKFGQGARFENRATNE